VTAADSFLCGSLPPSAKRQSNLGIIGFRRRLRQSALKCDGALGSEGKCRKGERRPAAQPAQGQCPGSDDDSILYLFECRGVYIGLLCCLASAARNRREASEQVKVAMDSSSDRRAERTMTLLYRLRECPYGSG
jgi:hypothetical protein